MPKEWYDFHSVLVKDGDNDQTIKRKEFNRQILAEKKPYYMIYVYPELGRQFRKYVKEADEVCVEKWGMSVFGLAENMNKDACTAEFLEAYFKKYPVTDGSGVMNRLCHFVESEFNGVLNSVKDKDYRYEELLTSVDFWRKGLDKNKAESVEKLYSLYRSFIKAVSAKADKSGASNLEANEKRAMLDEWFKRECDAICVSEVRQCDMLLKVCYSSEYSKRFVWKMCGERIVRNLLEKNGRYFYFVRDDEGETVYHGERYKKVTVTVGKEDFNENSDG